MTVRMLLCLIGLSLLGACKKKQAEATAPEVAKLLFPAKNEPCLSGVDISPSTSSVAFGWETPNHTDSFELTVKNLLTNEQKTMKVTGNRADMLLDKNTPYAWQIISLSAASSVRTKSETWKFYNSGPGVTTHVPYPAEAVSPLHGQSIDINAGRVTLQWCSSDADNDVLDHDLYLGTSASPGALSLRLAARQLEVTVSPKTRYYWKIVTRDSKGNLSHSDIFQFNTN